MPLQQRVCDGEVPLEAPGYIEFFGHELDPDTVVVDNGDDDTLDLDYWIQQGVGYSPNVNLSFAPSHSACTVYWSKRSAYKSEYGHLFEESDKAEIAQHVRRGVLKPIRADQVPGHSKVVPSLMSRQMKMRDGVPERAKSRLCANDSKNKENLEPSSTRTVTPRWSSIRSFFADAAGAMKAVYDYDLPWAFGAAPTDKVRHMQAPFDMREYTKDGVELMYEILNMQGLKVAGRNFQNFFNKWMNSLGFIQNVGDPSTYYRPAGPAPDQPDLILEEITMIVWIDDCCYATASNTTHQWFADQLQAKWDPDHVKQPSKLTDFVLGVKVTQRPGSISISSPALVDKLAKEMGMENCHPIDTPMATNEKVA
jgi:hypothetical protein